MRTVTGIVMVVFACLYILWRIKKFPKRNRRPLIKIIDYEDYGNDKIITVNWNNNFLGEQIKYITKGPKFKKFYSLENGNRCDRKIERTLRRHFALIRGGEESYSPN